MIENPPPVVEIENDIGLPQVQSMSKYHDKFLKTKQLQLAGHSKRKVAKLLEMSRNTVLKYWKMSSFLPKVGKKRDNLRNAEQFGSSSILVKAYLLLVMTTRFLSSSNLARPYICRLIVLSLLTWPSTGPLEVLITIGRKVAVSI